MKKYAGRVLTPEVLIKINTIAEYLAQRDWLLRSGGADAAFEAGCDKFQGSKESI